MLDTILVRTVKQYHCQTLWSTHKHTMHTHTVAPPPKKQTHTHFLNALLIQNNNNTCAKHSHNKSFSISLCCSFQQQLSNYTDFQNACMKPKHIQGPGLHHHRISCLPFQYAYKPKTKASFLFHSNSANLVCNSCTVYALNRCIFSLSPPSPTFIFFNPKKHQLMKTNSNHSPLTATAAGVCRWMIQRMSGRA